MSLDVDMERFIRKYRDRALTIKRKIAIDAFTSVVKMSPVDTGRFRGNWNPSFGSVDDSIDWQARDKSGSATIDAIVRQVQSAPLGPDLILANNLPYARPLEYGHSKQAPGGMVRVTVGKFQQYVNEAANEQ